jgi:hypothetical protein
VLLPLCPSEEMPSSRETRAVARRCGIRQRRFSIPPHFRDRRKDEYILSNRHGCRRLRVPRSKLQETSRKDVYELFAINGTTIAIYGTIPLTLNLRLRRDMNTQHAKTQHAATRNRNPPDTILRPNIRSLRQLILLVFCIGPSALGEDCVADQAA